MDAASWVAVFQRIPPDKEDLLVIVTTSGVEIVVQKIIRADSDFVILKGRISGAVDAARAVLMPFDEINNVAVNKQLLDTEILALFGYDASSEAAAVKPEPVAAKPAAQGPAPVSPSKPAAPSPSWAQGAAPASARTPSKSIFLERLRARLGGDSSKPDNT